MTARVKPLVWVAGNRHQYKLFDGIIYAAQLPRGVEGREVWHYMTDTRPNQFYYRGAWYPTLAAAQQVVQSDHTAMIEALLTPERNDPCPCTARRTRTSSRSALCSRS
jgi:hypothetical protein